MGRYGWLRYTDPVIRDILVALNDAGFTTVESCGGHNLPGGRRELGFIRFRPGVSTTKESKESIARIVRNFTDADFDLGGGYIRFRTPVREDLPPGDIYAVWISDALAGRESGYSLEHSREIVRELGSKGITLSSIEEQADIARYYWKRDPE